MVSAAKHCKAFDDFDRLFPSEIVQEWNAKVKAWDIDPKNSNPYAEPLAGKYIVVMSFRLSITKSNYRNLHG